MALSVTDIAPTLRRGSRRRDPTPDHCRSKGRDGSTGPVRIAPHGGYEPHLRDAAASALLRKCHDGVVVDANADQHVGTRAASGLADTTDLQSGGAHLDRRPSHDHADARGDPVAGARRPCAPLRTLRATLVVVPAVVLSLTPVLARLSRGWFRAHGRSAADAPQLARRNRARSRFVRSRTPMSRSSKLKASASTARDLAQPLNTSASRNATASRTPSLGSASIDRPRQCSCSGGWSRRPRTGRVAHHGALRQPCALPPPARRRRSREPRTHLRSRS
jgi:hypothetical protein